MGLGVQRRKFEKEDMNLNKSRVMRTKLVAQQILRYKLRLRYPLLPIPRKTNFYVADK